MSTATLFPAVTGNGTGSEVTSPPAGMVTDGEPRKVTGRTDVGSTAAPLVWFAIVTWPITRGWVPKSLDNWMRVSGPLVCGCTISRRVWLANGVALGIPGMPGSPDCGLAAQESIHCESPDNDVADGAGAAAPTPRMPMLSDVAAAASKAAKRRECGIVFIGLTPLHNSTGG